MPRFEHPMEYWETAIEQYLEAGSLAEFATRRGIGQTAASNLLQKARLKTGDETKVKDIRRLAVWNALTGEWQRVRDILDAIKPQGFDVDHETVQRDVFHLAKTRRVATLRPVNRGGRWKFRREA